MKKCEEYQLNVSAMIDGELHGLELTETIKHLAQCQSCLAQFEAFQQLDERIGEATVRKPVPEVVWGKISEETSPGRKAHMIKLRSHIIKAVSIAAVLAVSFTLGYQSRKNVIPMMKAGDPIVLASNRGDMNDAQFLSLTRELLTADPVYHKRMYLLLHTLTGSGWEGSIEPLDNLELEKNEQHDLLEQADFDEESGTYKF